MLVPQATHDGFVAAANAVRGATVTLHDQVSPIGGFTEPECASGADGSKAYETYDAVVTLVRFDETAHHHRRPDGRVCKLIADRATCTILGCHVAGDRAVETIQVVAPAMAAGWTTWPGFLSPSLPMPVGWDVLHTGPPANSISTSVGGGQTTDRDRDLDLTDGSAKLPLTARRRGEDRDENWKRCTRRTRYAS